MDKSICPQCGRPVRIKEGKYGPFYGCTGWPDCNFTAVVEYDQEFDIDEWKSVNEWAGTQAFLAGELNG